MDNDGQYILLPRRGLRAPSGPAHAALTSLPRVSSTQPRAHARLATTDRDIEIIDHVAEDGPKLVAMDASAAAAVNQTGSPLRAIPLVVYPHPNPRLAPLGGPSTLAAGATFMQFTVRDARSGAGLAGVDIVAFTNFTAKRGDSGTTDASGSVTLRLQGALIERLYCYPPAGHWGAFRRQIAISPSMTLTLEAVDLTFVDSVRHYYPNSGFQAATGVRVGVLDTGVGPHLDLAVSLGRNTVTGEPANDFLDADIHGTHVAGLIASNGAAPQGLRGLAPGVLLNAYRVFGAGADGATNYSILKAMILAAQDGCDILNLSLGGGPFDDIVRESIQDARDQGMLVVVAAGNDGRQSVSFPAAYAGATAVSAIGVEGTFPAGALEEADVQRPPHSSADANEFLASFSNVGPQIAVAAPGVGALSTRPGNLHGPLSGTSMAAPVVTGAAACLLSRDPVVFSMARNRARSDAIERLLHTSCSKRGFGLVSEGFGIPDPALV